MRTSSTAPCARARVRPACWRGVGCQIGDFRLSLWLCPRRHGPRLSSTAAVQLPGRVTSGAGANQQQGPNSILTHRVFSFCPVARLARRARPRGPAWRGPAPSQPALTTPRGVLKPGENKT